ncbi:carboxymuconolactone decarboxylase family protein [Streptomyces sp. NPDC001153]
MLPPKLSPRSATPGSVPNLAKVMANSPALVKGWLALSGALSEGVIPAPVRERLAIATAQYNNCEYCLSAHTCIGAHVAEVDAEELERARDAESGPHIAAPLALSDTIARGHGSTDERQLKARRAAGVADAEMAEVTGNLGLNLLTNYFNLLADTDNAWPVVTPCAHN